ncbi:hypothetical protein CHH52_10155 [Shouchella clausii]|nr:hypothetical protein CHH52_10155 [Shouchella clausii]
MVPEKEEDFVDLEEHYLEEEAEQLEEGLLDVMDLFVAIPDEIIEYGTMNDGIEWLNANKGPEFEGQIFVADGDSIVLEVDPDYIGVMGVGDCIWAIGKAIAMNALPWAKIVKIKKAVQIMGGTRVVANTLINAYKHQRNLGYSRSKAIKRAIDVSKRAVPRVYVKHWVEFFSLGAIQKNCF